MKFINYTFLITLILLCSCIKKKDVKDPHGMYPPYKLINLSAKKIQPETGLILRTYGINSYLPREYEYKNGIANFISSYSLSKKKEDEISLDYARSLIIILSENLLKDINANDEIKSDLDVYPFTNDLLYISIYFEDEIRVELGKGVANVMLSKGKITYEGYNILEYRDRPPARGEHYVIHEESYADALEIVKKQGTLKYL